MSYQLLNGEISTAGPRLLGSTVIEHIRRRCPKARVWVKPWRPQYKAPGAVKGAGFFRRVFEYGEVIDRMFVGNAERIFDTLCPRSFADRTHLAQRIAHHV